MELRHLRYFVAVAEQQHFGRAAEILGIAQPPLSQQIRQLESELGLKLLLRTSRRVSLTDAGQAFLIQCRAILSLTEKAVEEAWAAEVGRSGHVTVGFIASAALESAAGYR